MYCCSLARTASPDTFPGCGEIGEAGSDHADLRLGVSTFNSALSEPRTGGGVFACRGIWGKEDNDGSGGREGREGNETCDRSNFGSVRLSDCVREGIREGRCLGGTYETASADGCGLEFTVAGVSAVGWVRRRRKT
jgi:hypothetical protein